ncbi:MAG: dUTP diphosphatase [Clostridia bacterium]|nr:dUTP diphosphatase [Clostridia bacterium]
MEVIKVKSKNGQLPEYKTIGSAGMDLAACIDEDITLMPMERRLVPTGLWVELPQGMEVQVRARSGLSIRNGITLINGIGTVDSDYRGEWNVPLVNLSNEAFTIHNGDRIAQAVFMKYEKVELKLADSVDETERGDGGFGSTGI